MLVLHILYFFICLSREFIKATNGLVMNPEEGKRFLCVWLLFYAMYFLVLMITGTFALMKPRGTQREILRKRPKDNNKA